MIIRTIKLTIALACLVAPCARGMQLSQAQKEAEIERLFGAIRASKQCVDGTPQAEDIKRDFARGFYLLGPLARHPLSPDARNRLDQDLPEHAPRSCQDGRAHRFAPADERANEPIMEILYRGAPWLLDYALDMIDQSIRSNGLVISTDQPNRLVIRNMNMGPWTLPKRNDRGQEANAANLAHLEEISLLHTAALELRPEMVARLIACGADVNATTNTFPPFPLTNMRGARKATTPLFYLATTVNEPSSEPAMLSLPVRHTNKLRTPEDRDAQLQIATLLAEAGARNIGDTETGGCARGALSIADPELFRHLMQYPSIQQSTQLWGLALSYFPPARCQFYSELEEQQAVATFERVEEKISLLLLHASVAAVNHGLLSGSMLADMVIFRSDFHAIEYLLAHDIAGKLNLNATTRDGDTLLDVLTQSITTGLHGMFYSPDRVQPLIDRLVELGALTGEELRQQQADNDPAAGAAPGDPAVDGHNQ